MSYKKVKFDDGQSVVRRSMKSNFKTIDLKLMPENLIFSYGTDAEKEEMHDKIAAVHAACFWTHTDGKEYRFLVRDAKTQQYVIKIPQVKVDGTTLPLFSLPKSDADMIADYVAANDNLNAFLNPLFYKYLDRFKGIVIGVDVQQYWLIGIVHDKDYNCDDFWEPSIEKPHIHLNGKAVCRNYQLCSWLKMLGIKLRKDIDDVAFFEGHGLRSISERDDSEYGNKFSRAVNYLTHDTDQARMDGKYQYPETDLFTNLDDDELLAIRKGTRPSCLSTSELARICKDLDAQAYDVGYSLRDFDDWWAEQPYEVRKRASDRKAISETYNRGLSARVEERQELDKLVLILGSDGNCGKTTTAKLALNSLGYSDHDICYITTSGSGKYDGVKVYHRACIIDDVYASSMLSLFDSRMCTLKARNYNRVFTGDIIIILTNKKPADYIKSALGSKSLVGEDDCDESVHVSPIRSRVCLASLSVRDGFPVISDIEYGNRGNAHAFNVGARADRFLDAFRSKIITYDFSCRPNSQQVKFYLKRYGSDAELAFYAFRAYMHYESGRLSLEDFYNFDSSYDYEQAVVASLLASRMLADDFPPFVPVEEPYRDIYDAFDALPDEAI